MKRNELFKTLTELYGTEPDYPWHDWNAVLRHTNNKKWYAVVLEVQESKLGLTGDRIVDALNVKCDLQLIGSLRQQHGFYPAYHMNKDSWISILLDGSVPAEIILNLVDMSYQLTKEKIVKDAHKDLSQLALRNSSGGIERKNSSEKIIKIFEKVSLIYWRRHDKMSKQLSIYKGNDSRY